MKIKAVIFIILIVNSLLAQIDSVLLNNGEKLIIKVVSITDKKINYTLPTNAKKIISISKNEINKLWLNNQNSTIETTSLGPKLPNKNLEELGSSPTYFNKNYIGLNIGQLVLNSISLNYQYINKEGTAGLKLLAACNFAPKNLNIQYLASSPRNQNFTSLFRKLTAGFELDCYLYNQKKASWYFGASFQVATFSYYYSDQGLKDSINAVNYSYNPDPALFLPAKRTATNGISTAVMFNTGWLLRLTPNIYIDCGVGVGPQRFLFGYVEDNFKAIFSFQIVMGYNF